MGVTLTLSELFEYAVYPPHGWERRRGSIDYAIENLPDGRRWLILQGTTDARDVLRDLQAAPERVEIPGAGGAYVLHQGIAEAAQTLRGLDLGGYDSIVGYSLGGGEAQALGLLTGRPWYAFGAPRIVYQAPRYAEAMTRGLHVVVRGDPVGYVAPWASRGGVVLTIGRMRLWPRAAYHQPGYYREALAASGAGSIIV